MKSILVVINSNLKKGIVLMLFSIVFFGCQTSDGGSSGGEKPVEPPAIENSAPVFVSNNCPAVVYENTTVTCKISATDVDGDTITYSLSDTLNGAISIDSNTGDISGTAPEVSQDYIYSLTAKATDNKGAETPLPWEFTLKNVEANVLPEIQGLVLSGTASADANNIYQTWGKNIEGSIFAIDGNDDVINYNVDASGDELYPPSINGNEFSIGTKKPTSTDATHDLGQIVLEACDEKGCDTKTFGVVGKNPIEADIYFNFNEDGTFYTISDATSDGSDFIQVTFNISSGYYSGSPSLTGTATQQKLTVLSPIIAGYQYAEISWENETADERVVIKGFTPATESEARASIDNILENAGLVENTDYWKDYRSQFTASSDPNCPVPGQQVDITIDYLGLLGDHAFAINYRSIGDEDIFDIIVYCSNSSARVILDISLRPLENVVSDTQSFVDNGFQH